MHKNISLNRRCSTRVALRDAWLITIEVIKLIDDPRTAAELQEAGPGLVVM